MLDSTIPVSPKVAIVMSLDEGPSRILIDKNKTDVIYVEPYHARSNTRAYINEYDTEEKVNVIRNHREIHYDRIDLTQLIQDISVLTPDNNDQLCHVIHTASTIETVRNLDTTAFCELLSNEYDIPVLPTDFVDNTLERVKVTNTTMGNVYRSMNCIITDIEVAYSGGTITHFDKLMNGVVSRPGFVLTREWTHGEVLSILPNESVDKTGWSIDIGFNDDVEYTTPVTTNLTLSQDSKSEDWQVNYDGEVVAEFDGARESGVTIAIGNGILLIGTVGSEPTSVTVETPELHYNRGIMRILTYTNNPYPSLFKIGFDVTMGEVLETDGLSINDKVHAPIYNLVSSDPRSNAVVKNIVYPVSISPYKTSNYAERAQDIFKPISDSTHGSLNVFVKPDGFKSQKVTFLLGYTDGTLPVETISTVLLTVTDTRNVNNKLYVKTIPLSNGTTLVGSGPSVNALVFETLEQTTGSELFSVTIAAGTVDVTEDELVIGQYVSGEQVSSNDISIYKVDIEVNVKGGKTLPNIDVVHTPSLTSNE